MVDLIGVGLLIVGLALIVAELTFPGYYLGVAGTVGVVIGLAQMVWPWFLMSPSSAIIAAVVATVAAAASFRFYRKFASPIDRLGGSAGPELVGRGGVVTQPVRPHTTRGRVEIDGRLWGADADRPLPTGTRIIVEEVRGTHVLVRQEQGASDAAMNP